jgi:D-alanine transaminase
MSTVLYNNEFIERSKAKVDIEDRGYQFGDGIYEVVRVYNGKFFELNSHIKRLYQSADEIKLKIPHSKEELSELLHLLIQKDGIDTGYVYLQYTRGVAPRSHPFPPQAKPVLTAYANEKPRPLEQMDKGIDAITVEDIRWMLCHIKSLNLIGAVLANQQAHEQGKGEAILHRNGTVTECSHSNIFIVKDVVLYTHPANHLILNGITRQVVIQLAKQNGISVVEEPFTLQELAQADEVFASGTTIEVMPIVSINDIPVGDGKPGMLTRKLQQLFSEKIESKCK